MVNGALVPDRLWPGRDRRSAHPMPLRGGLLRTTNRELDPERVPGVREVEPNEHDDWDREPEPATEAGDEVL